MTGDVIRLRLTVQYDGSAFHGWQFQPDQRTVQGEMERVLAQLAGSPRTVVGSGRTDTGVHATGQVASVDMPLRWTPANLQRAMNALLPRDIWVRTVEQAAPDFHPRFDAIRRTYEYRIGTSPDAKSPFHRSWCWALGEPLDEGLLHAAAKAVVGERSFGAFAKAGQPERGERCRVERAEWDTWALGVRFTITADRYLHHMVRYLVGTMVEVARGRRPLDEMVSLLRGGSRLSTSPPAPPEGLFLKEVEYPGDSGSPQADPPARSRSAEPA